MPPRIELAERLLGMFRWMRSSRLDVLMPSILFDDPARFGDLGLTLDDIEEHRRRRSRGR